MAKLHATPDEITTLLKTVKQLTIFGLKEGVSLEVAEQMKEYGFDIVGVHPRRLSQKGFLVPSPSGGGRSLEHCM